jgi:hypothetical protein
MSTDSNDWRTPLCQDLAGRAHRAGLNRNDRAAFVRMLHELAELERREIGENSEQFGYLRAVNTYGAKGLTQLHTIAKKFWPVEVGESSDNLPTGPQESSDPDPEPPKPEVPEVVLEETEVCYQIVCNQAYSAEALLETFGTYVAGNIGGRKFEAVSAKSLPNACDLVCKQTCSISEVVEILSEIPWVCDVLSKPPQMYGRRL